MDWTYQISTIIKGICKRGLKDLTEKRGLEFTVIPDEIVQAIRDEHFRNIGPELEKMDRLYAEGFAQARNSTVKKGCGGEKKKSFLDDYTIEELKKGVPIPKDVWETLTEEHFKNTLPDIIKLVYARAQSLHNTDRVYVY